MPVPWIWDIIDEFIYQFYVCSKWRRTASANDEAMKKINEKIENEDMSYWNLSKVLEIFNSFIKRSKIL